MLKCCAFFYQTYFGKSIFMLSNRFQASYFCNVFLLNFVHKYYIVLTCDQACYRGKRTPDRRLPTNIRRSIEECQVLTNIYLAKVQSYRCKVKDLPAHWPCHIHISLYINIVESCYLKNSRGTKDCL